MSAQQTSITILLIIGFTFIFDIMELQPRVGFGFLRSLNYLFYHMFRVLLGLLAAFLIIQINPGMYPPLLSFLSVLGSVTTLQNFAVNVGGNEVGSLSRLLDNYKERMLTEQEQRNNRHAAQLAYQTASRALLTQQEMLTLFTETELEMQLRQLLLHARWGAAAINAHLQELKTSAQGTQEFLEAVMAFQIIEMNPEYARSMVEERRRSAAHSRSTI